MNIWIYILLFIDLVILVVAVFIYSKSRNSKDISPVNDDLKRLIASLHGIVDKAEDISKTLAKQIDRGEDAAAMINERVERADSYAKKDLVINDSGSISTDDKDKYKEVARLVRDGLSNKEISRRSGVPEGEVELIVNLRRDV